MLTTLRSILGNPASNPQVIAIVVAIAVAAVLFLAFVLIGLAVPRATDLSEEAADERRAARRREAGCGISLLIVVVGAIAATAIWYRSTSSVSYCTTTCHQMAAPALTWSISVHDRVTCIRCHEGTGWAAVPTGLAMRASCVVSEITGRPTKRFPVPQSRCLECHQAVLDAPMRARNGEMFTHRDELASGATCESCHGKQGHVPPRARN